MREAVCALVLMGAAAFPVLAQQPTPGMVMHGSADVADSPSTQAFKAANDKEILLGNHDKEYPSKAVIQVDPDSDQVPYFVRNIPRLVETRGGDYFFIPSLTALRMIAKGLVDPT